MKGWFGKGYQTMISSFDNFFVVPICAEFQAEQVAEGPDEEEIPNLNLV